MIGLVVALSSEANPLIEIIENKKTSKIINKPLIQGELNGKQVTLIISGIGKVNSAMCAQLLIDRFGVNTIINFGSVGGLPEKVEAMRYYMAEKACQYDFDLSALDPVSVGYIQDYDCVHFNCNKFDSFLPLVTLASSDRFTHKQSDVDTIKALNSDIFDMEGGAIAEVCTANNVKLYIVKGVTDVFGSGLQSGQFVKNLQAVCAGFPDKIIKLLGLINE